MPAMIIFYDGECPLCRKEMVELKRHDHHDKVELVDVHSERFEQEFPQVGFADAMALLHGYDDNGKLLTGLDVTVLAWQSVNKHRWLAILRWPVIRPVADWCYKQFAAHRMSISRMLAPSQCTLDKKGCHRD